VFLVAKKTTDNLISWTIEELFAHKEYCSKEVIRLKEEVVATKRKIVNLTEQFDLYMGTVRKIERHLESRKIETFETKLRKEYGSHLTDKQHAKVWRKAWEDGHSSGEYEVQNHYIDLAEMFEEE
jgi:hypothetical protein